LLTASCCRALRGWVRAGLLAAAFDALPMSLLR
jgi:hypothetical protein